MPQTMHPKSLHTALSHGTDLQGDPASLESSPDLKPSSALILPAALGVAALAVPGVVISMCVVMSV